MSNSEDLISLTERQVEILQFLDTHYSQYRNGPTLNEIAQTIGLTHRSSVSYHMYRLEKNDLIENIKYKRRTYRLSPKGQRILALLKMIEGT